MFTSYIVFGRPNANSFMGNRLQGAPGQACPGVTQVPFQYVDLFPNWETGVEKIISVIRKTGKKRERLAA